MTYLQFHLFFNVPLLFFLALAAAPFLLASQVIIAILIVLAIVMVFTTPWDNYAAFKGIWGFSEGQYTKKIGYLPIEEYLFFITQSLQAMMLTMIISSWLPEIETIATSFTLFSPGSLAIGLGISAIFILIGWKVGLPLAPFSKWQYTWHLFFWFGLVWSLQLWVGWSILLPRWPILLGVTLLLESGNLPLVKKPDVEFDRDDIRNGQPGAKKKGDREQDRPSG
ncbi:MAG: lycopene cyclase domain-containing protein, partial [Verrucomicrobiota bacterium]